MRLQLHHSPSTKRSQSLKAIAVGLSTAKGRKVWRTTKLNLKRTNLFYGQSVNKIIQYKYFKENDIPALEYTTDVGEAQQWVTEGNIVFGRALLNSSCGKGIIDFLPEYENTPIDGPICPVYTKYKKKKREFRVHVYKDTVVAVVEKKRKKEFTGERDTKIRNLANGYVFCQGVENEPEGLRDLALRAARVSNSHFRGVDIGYNEKKDELFVIEVNSAPGIQGSNVTAYVNTILSKE